MSSQWYGPSSFAARLRRRGAAASNRGSDSPLPALAAIDADEDERVVEVQREVGAMSSGARRGKKKGGSRSWLKIDASGRVQVRHSLLLSRMVYSTVLRDVEDGCSNS